MLLRTTNTIGVRCSGSYECCACKNKRTAVPPPTRHLDRLLWSPALSALLCSAVPSAADVFTPRKHVLRMGKRGYIGDTMSC